MIFPPAPALGAPQSDVQVGLVIGWRGRPAPPRALRTSQGSLETIVFWNGPVDLRGVNGWRVYEDIETKKVWESQDPTVRQVRIKIPSTTSRLFFVSCFSKLGRESAKIPVVGSSNTDKMVVDGTTGETGGTAPAPPPEWEEEPTGGCVLEGTEIIPLGHGMRLTSEENQSWIEIELADGRRLTATPDHPIYTDRGKIPLAEVALSESVVTSRGLVPVKAKRKLSFSARKLIVTLPGQLFYANGILSHNKRVR